MFGFGKTTKTIYNNASIRIKDTYLAKQSSAAFYRELEQKYYMPEYFINIVPKYKIIYVEIPKAACSTIKTILSRSAVGTKLENWEQSHVRKKSGLLSPRMFGLDNFLDLVEDPDALIFTVTRHPLDRLTSCYLDKFQSHPVSGPSPFNKEALAILTEQEKQCLDPQEPLPFETFVRMACRSNYSRKNGHWSAMSDIVPTEMIEFTHIGRLDAIQDTMKLLRDRGIPASAFPAQAINRKKQQDAALETSKDLAGQINQSYAADFTNFNYDLIGC